MFTLKIHLLRSAHNVITNPLISHAVINRQHAKEIGHISEPLFVQICPQLLEEIGSTTAELVWMNFEVKINAYNTNCPRFPCLHSTLSMLICVRSYKNSDEVKCLAKWAVTKSK